MKPLVYLGVAMFFDFITNVMAKLTPYLPSKFKIDNNYEDIGDKLALEIIREGIANAINNCDYFLPTGVYIKYEDNHLKIRNAERMRLPLNQALRGSVSDPRNEGLMNLLHLLRIGDKGGLGIPNMINRARELNIPDSTFVESFNPEITTLNISFVESTKENSNSDYRSKIIVKLLKI